MSSNRLFSYIVIHDTGFAPNPFFDVCTLACCKPKIRKSAQVGDWVIGLTPKQDGHRIVYFMQVDEVIPSYAAYWQDRRFGKKKPRFDASTDSKCGDNIYMPEASGGYRQLESVHSQRHPYAENLNSKARDLSGERVLTSTCYTYYGRQAPALPDELQFLIAARGHRCRFTDMELATFRQFIAVEGFHGLKGLPHSWKDADRVEASSTPRSCAG